MNLDQDMSRRMNSPWGDNVSEDESDEARLLNGRDRVDYRSIEDQYLREHEEGLEKLGEAIRRQKYIAGEIGTEVEVQNEILDNIDTGLTKTNDSVRKSTRNIKLVSRKSSTFYLWIIIVILAVVIAALAII